jgi:Family of unknown function (DUF6204)
MLMRRTYQPLTYRSGVDEAARVTSVYRVTVRGQFRDLSPAARTLLESSLADHDLFRSSFTEEGTFTYDAAIRFFNLRYEVRTTTADRDPAEVALDEAGRFLSTMKIGHGPLRAAVMNMSAMTERSGPTGRSAERRN